jgi:hypothetical protein
MQDVEPGQPERRSRRLHGSLLLLIAVPALLLGLWILDVSSWFGINVRGTFGFRWLDFLPNLLSSWRVPPLAQFGFLALVLALTGFYLWFRESPQLGVLTSPAPAAPEGPPVSSRSWFVSGSALVLAAAVLFSVTVVARSSLAKATPPLGAWAAGPACLIALACLADRRVGKRVAWDRSFLNLAYLGGIVSLLTATVYLFRGRALLACVCLALAIGLFEPVFRRGWATWDVAHRVERLAVPVLTVGSFLLCSYGLDSWAWGLQGDDFSFFDTASRLARGELPLSLGTDAHGYHPVLSSLPSAICMRVFGPDSLSWRLGNPLLFAMSIPFFHYAFRAFLGPGGALAADTLLGGSHYLQSFFKIGYNNPLALASLGVSLACLTWALRRRTWLAFAVTGLALGLGFFTFGVAWLFPVILATWLAVYSFPTAKTNLGAWLTVAGVVLVTALPMLLNEAVIKEYLAHSPLASGTAGTPPPETTVAARCLYGLALFVTNRQHTHGVVTAHTDPITGAGVILGVAALLAGWKEDPRSRRAWLGLAAAAIITVAGFQRYNYPANTRMFVLVPVYAFIGAVGLLSLSRRLFPRAFRRQRLMQNVTAVLLVASSLFLNTMIALVVSPRRSVRGIENYLALYVQRSVGPPPATLLLGGRPNVSDLEDFLRSAGVGPTRLRTLGPSMPLQWKLLEHFGDTPAICLVPRNAENAVGIRALAAAAWPGSREFAVGDYMGSPSLFAVVNQKARLSLRAVPGYWREEETRDRPAPVTPEGEAFDVGWFEVVNSFQQHGELGRDHSVHGSPLSVAGRVFASGLGTHANSRIQLRLDSGYGRFVGECGVDDEVGKEGSVIFRIVQRGRTLFVSPVVHGGNSAVPIDIDVKGCQDLTLLVEDADGSIGHDHADWLDLRLVP